MLKKMVHPGSYLPLIFAFLYLPIIVLIALSFNYFRSKVKWAALTSRWYRLFSGPKIL